MDNSIGIEPKMELHHLGEKLHAHEESSQNRYKKVAKKLECIKHEMHSHYRKEEEMSGKDINIHADGVGTGGLGMMAAMLGGGRNTGLEAGGGALVGSTIGSFLTRLIGPGLGGGYGYDGYGRGGCAGGGETNAQVVDQIMLNNIQTKLGDVDKDVFVNGLTTNNLVTQTALQAQIAACTAMAQTNQNIAAGNYATQTAIKDAQYAITVNADKNAQVILARIDANTIDQLRAELSEVRHEGRSARQEINVTNTATNTVAQAQQQQQFQAVVGELAGLRRCLELNHQEAKNSLVAIGSTLLGTGQSNANTSVK